MINRSDAAELDVLATEAVDDRAVDLDALSVTQLVDMMNERDAAIARSVRVAMPAIVDAIEATVERMRRGGRLIYVGAGTSGRLGILDAAEVPPTFGVTDVVMGLIAGGLDALVNSAESAEDSEAGGAEDLQRLEPTELDTVLGIASSGRTPYVLGAIRFARERGALTIGLSCNVGTPLTALADLGIEVAVGPEILSGSTRLGAGTATKMVLNMFSTITMIRLGKTYRTLMVDVLATNAKLVRRAVRIVRMATGADEATARAALDAADWHAKVAIAMIAAGISAEQARAELDAVGGTLRSVIEQVDGNS